MALADEKYKTDNLIYDMVSSFISTNDGRNYKDLFDLRISWLSDFLYSTSFLFHIQKYFADIVNFLLE